MIYLMLIGALVVTHAMLRRLTSRRCIIIIIIIIIIMQASMSYISSL